MPCLHDATHEGHEACMVLRDDGKWECYMCCAHLAPRDMDVLLPFHQLCKSKDKGKRKYRKTITFSGYTGCLGKAMPVSTSGQHNCSTCFAHIHSTCGSGRRQAAVHDSHVPSVWRPVDVHVLRAQHPCHDCGRPRQARPSVSPCTA